MRGGIEELQRSRCGSGINGGGAEAAEAAGACRQPGLLSVDGKGTLEGGFKQLLQHCRGPKM